MKEVGERSIGGCVEGRGGSQIDPPIKKTTFRNPRPYEGWHRWIYKTKNEKF